MCGMCVPHCPTYALTKNEADGPRGRISLMLGMHQGRLEPDAHITEHLDGCLSCRACERICPSKVPYGTLIDAGRARLLAAAPDHQGGMRRLRDAVLLRPVRLRLLGQAARMAQSLRLDRLPLPRTLKRLALLAPPLTAPLSAAEMYPATSARRGSIGLFLGCMGPVFEPENLRAAIRVLTAWGFDVHVPSTQGCCGAMHQHGGEPERGQAMAREATAPFGELRLDALVGISSGCMAQLAEHGGRPAYELSDFLIRNLPNPMPEMKPVARKVAVHLPCTQRNVLRTGNTAMKLLALIPGLEVIELPGNDRCCGAAGTHMLTHPEQADTLRAPKIDAIKTLDADQLASTNIGCAMHLGAGLRATDRTAEVVHPVRLLAEALGAAK